MTGTASNAVPTPPPAPTSSPDETEDATATQDESAPSSPAPAPAPAPPTTAAEAQGTSQPSGDAGSPGDESAPTSDTSTDTTSDSTDTTSDSTDAAPAPAQDAPAAQITEVAWDPPHAMPGETVKLVAKTQGGSPGAAVTFEIHNPDETTDTILDTLKATADDSGQASIEWTVADADSDKPGLHWPDYYFIASVEGGGDPKKSDPLDKPDEISLSLNIRSSDGTTKTSDQKISSSGGSDAGGSS
jgi:hypothetical protein